MQTGRRQARLRQEFAGLYPGVPANEWRPIGELLDCVAAARLRGGRRSGELLLDRPLDDRHFEFRGRWGAPGRVHGPPLAPQRLPTAPRLTGSRSDGPSALFVGRANGGPMAARRPHARRCRCRLGCGDRPAGAGGG